MTILYGHRAALTPDNFLIKPIAATAIATVSSYKSLQKHANSFRILGDT